MTAIKILSDSALRLIASFEGFSAVPYPDAQGYSVGFGHFILPSDNFTYPMDKNTAHALLASDAKLAADAVETMVKVLITQNQRDALISLVYNIGRTAFANSTLLRKLNAGDYQGAAAEFLRWNKSQRQTLSVLTSRRYAEQQYFLA